MARLPFHIILIVALAPLMAGEGTGLPQPPNNRRLTTLQFATLLDIYTGVRSSTLYSLWNVTAPECTWRGVTCNAAGFVTYAAVTVRFVCRTAGGGCRLGKCSGGIVDVVI